MWKKGGESLLKFNRFIDAAATSSRTDVTHSPLMDVPRGFQSNQKLRDLSN